MRLKVSVSSVDNSDIPSSTRGRTTASRCTTHTAGQHKRPARRAPIATVLANDSDDPLAGRVRGALDTLRSLHWGHWLFAALSLLVTIVAALSVGAAEDARADRFFGGELERTVDLLTDRLQRYEDLLWASVAKIAAVDRPLAHAEWLALLDRLVNTDEYPAITGSAVGFAVASEDLSAFIEERRRERPGYTVWPEGEATVHLPLAYARPDEIQRRFEGIDATHNPPRRATILRAARLNAVSATTPMAIDTSGELDFVLLAPFYRNHEVPAPPLREKRLAGWIGISIRVRSLLEGILAENRRDIRIRLSDGDMVIYDERNAARGNFDPDPLERARAEIAVYGRSWWLDAESALTFRREFGGGAAWVVLAAGLLIDALLFSLLVMLSRTKARAESAAAHATRSLRAKEKALARTNEERQGFAHLIAQGLTMPLRDIGTLAAHVRVDLDRPFDASTRREIRSNLVKVHQEAAYTAALIDGVLSYYNPPGLEEMPERCELGELLEGVSRRLELDRSRLRRGGEVGVLSARRTCLEQALTQLIDNAFAHHPDPGHAHVTVSTESRGKFVRFYIADDGLGIDPSHHERIFELLHTVRSRSTTPRAGVGLPIVRRIVERTGGTISVRSALGEGSTFVVDWPREQDTNAGEETVPPERRAA